MISILEMDSDMVTNLDANLSSSNLDQANYIFCEEYRRPQIHYIYPENQLEIMTVQKLGS